MRRYSIKWCVFLLTQIVIIKGIQPSNDSSSDESRQPRVSGRIVKLYSGHKPEPVICKGEGFQADNEDCTIFYRCIKGSRGKYTVLRFQCGPGTVYDPDTEICNHPQNTKRIECRSGRPFQFLSAPVEQLNENDIQSFAQELPSPITTQNQLYNKQTFELTSLPTYYPSLMPIALQSSEYGAYDRIETKPHTSEIVTTELPISASSIVSTPYQWTATTLQYKSTTSSANVKQVDECIHDGFMGDTKECRKFYRCVNDQRGGFIKYEFKCSESTIWDDDLQSCNHAWAVRNTRCARGISANVNISKDKIYNLQENNNITKEVTSGYGLYTTVSPVKVNTILSPPTQFNYGDRVTLDKNWDNKNNNNIYNDISNNQETHIKYPIEDEKTDYLSHNLDSSSQTHTQSYDTITKTSTYLYNVNHDIVYSTNYPIKKAVDTICVNSGFIGDSNDCRKFYRCVENGKGSYTRHEFLCGEGTAWDKNIESCNHVWMVKECGPRIISTTTSEKSYTGNINTTPISIISDDAAYTSGGYNLQKDDEQPVTLRTTTVLPEVTETLLKPSKLNESQAICNSVGYMGSGVDCKIFYRCVENGNGGFTKFEYVCGEGAVWDPSIEACNHAEAVEHCGNYINNETKANTSSTESTIITTISFVQTTIQSSDNNNNNVVENVSSNNRETTVKTFTTSNINIDNKCNENGFMADSYDCQKFYRCVDNGNGVYTRFEYLCGEGTVWDINISACNHLWAVEKCGNNISATLSESIPLPRPPSQSVGNLDNTDTNEIQDNIIRTTDSTILLSSSSKTTDSNDINSCTNSGFIGDEIDCTKFYRCVLMGDGSFKQYEFSCGEGTVWDPEIEACNHIWAVKKCGSGSKDQHKVSTTMSSTTFLYPNNELIGYTTQGYDNYTAVYVEGSFIQGVNDVTDVESTCLSEGFYPNLKDCKKFFRCVNNGNNKYIRYDFTCGEGTIWVQAIQACDHENDNSTCSTEIQTVHEGHVTTTTLRTSSDINNEMPNKNMESTNIASDQNYVGDNKCRSEGYYENLNDCRQFYRCVLNEGTYTKYDYFCAEGTAWDANTQSCNYISTVKSCLNTNVQTSQSTTILQNEAETERIQTTKSTTSVSESTSMKNDASNNCHSEGYFGNKDNCQKFYRCVDNGKGDLVKHDYICGDGTIWDQDITACNHPRDVKNPSCGHEIINSSSTTLSVASIQSTTSSSFSNQSQSTSPLPPQTSTIQIETESQTTEKIQTTISSTLVPEATSKKDNALNDCYSEGYFGNKGDCHKFYRCVDNGKGGFVKYDYICGDGTIWDQDITACNHPRDVKNPSCGHEIIISSSTTLSVASIQSTTSSSFSNQSQSTFSTPTQTTIIQTTTTEAEPQTTERVQTTKSPTSVPESTSKTDSVLNDCYNEGYFGNKDNCQKFYRCVDNGKGYFVKHDYICGDGTIWDQDITACNHPRDVKSPSCGHESINSSSTTHSWTSIQSTTSSSSLNQSQSTFPTPMQTTVIPIEAQTQTTERIQTTKSSTSVLESTSKKDNALTECYSEGYFGNKEDCQKFYRCVDNGKGEFVKYDYICGDGTIWDQDITACNHPRDVKSPSCSPETINSSSTTHTVSPIQSTTTSFSSNPSESTSTTPTQTTISSNESSNQPTSNCSGEETSKNNNNQNITCTKAGYYPNLSDCKKFYRCVDWDGNGQRFSVFHFECGEGTIWDPALDTCNYEHSVYPPRNCSGSQLQNNTDTTTVAQENSSSTIYSETTTQSSQTTEEPIRTESTTTQQTSSSEITTLQSTTTDGQSTAQQSSTSDQMSTTTAIQIASTTTTIAYTDTTTTSVTPTDTTSTTLAPTDMTSTTMASTHTTPTTVTVTDTSSTTMSSTDTTSTIVTSTDTTSTTSDQTTSDTTTTSEKSTTVIESSTSGTEQQTSTTTEQSSTEPSTTQTAVTLTEKSTTQEETTSQVSSTEQQTSTELTEKPNASSTTEESTSSTNTGTTTESTQETTTKGNTPGNKCPDTESDQFLYACPTSFKRHPKYCNLFYQCLEDNDSHELKIAVFNCPNGTIYDENKIQCVEESKSEKKCEGTMAKRQRFKRLNLNKKETIKVTGNKFGCPGVGHYPFEKDEKCSPALLKCEMSKGGKLGGFVYRCPENYVYWSVSRRCEPISTMTDCKYSSNQWIERPEIPVERKNIARLL